MNVVQWQIFDFKTSTLQIYRFQMQKKETSPSVDIIILFGIVRLTGVNIGSIVTAIDDIFERMEEWKNGSWENFLRFS